MTKEDALSMCRAYGRIRAVTGVMPHYPYLHHKRKVSNRLCILLFSSVYRFHSHPDVHYLRQMRENQAVNLVLHPKPGSPAVWTPANAHQGCPKRACQMAARRGLMMMAVHPHGEEGSTLGGLCAFSFCVSAGLGFRSGMGTVLESWFKTPCIPIGHIDTGYLSRQSKVQGLCFSSWGHPVNPLPL